MKKPIKILLSIICAIVIFLLIVSYTVALSGKLGIVIQNIAMVITIIAMIVIITYVVYIQLFE